MKQGNRMAGTAAVCVPVGTRTNIPIELDDLVWNAHKFQLKSVQVKQGRTDIRSVLAKV